MSIIAAFLTADDHIGKVDRLALPPQALAELLVRGFEAFKNFQDEDGAFTDIASWDGLYHAEDGTLETICWRSPGFFAGEMAKVPCAVIQPFGSIEFAWMPDVSAFSIVHLRLRGSIDTAVLPRRLTYLNCSTNKLVGSFRLDDIPQGMTFIDIGHNQFVGELNVPALPDSITAFDATYNAFSGKVSLETLPVNIKLLSLNDNKFCADVVLVGRLPEKLDKIYLQRDGIGAVQSKCGQNIKVQGRSAHWLIEAYASKRMPNMIDLQGDSDDDGWD